VTICLAEKKDELTWLKQKTNTLAVQENVMESYLLLFSIMALQIISN
jgi:hypothetical protein